MEVYAKISHLNEKIISCFEKLNLLAKADEKKYLKELKQFAGDSPSESDQNESVAEILSSVYFSFIQLRRLLKSLVFYYFFWYIVLLRFIC